MALATILRGDVLIADRAGRAQLVGNGASLATLLSIEAVPGGFGTSPFGLSFGTGGSQPNTAGNATVVAVTGQATLQTTS